MRLLVRLSTAGNRPVRLMTPLFWGSFNKFVTVLRCRFTDAAIHPTFMSASCIPIILPRSLCCLYSWQNTNRRICTYSCFLWTIQIEMPLLIKGSINENYKRTVNREYCIWKKKFTVINSRYTETELCTYNSFTKVLPGKDYLRISIIVLLFYTVKLSLPEQVPKHPVKL